MGIKKFDGTREDGQARVQGRMKEGQMIQETEVKQRSARMVDPFNSFQFIDRMLKQEVSVQNPTFHQGKGGASV